MMPSGRVTEIFLSKKTFLNLRFPKLLKTIYERVQLQDKLSFFQIKKEYFENKGWQNMYFQEDLSETACTN